MAEYVSSRHGSIALTFGVAAACCVTCGPRIDSSVSSSTTDAATGPTASASTDPSSTASASDTTGGATSVGSSDTLSTGSVSSESSSGDEVADCLVLQNYDLGGDGECDTVYEGPPGGCTAYNDQCPLGQKCSEYQECIDVVADPRQLYEVCVELELGRDDCDRGLRCLSGSCYATCLCNYDSPHCESADARCAVTAEIGSCLPTCDLLEPTCPRGSACIAKNYAAVCTPSVTQGSGSPGVPCASDGCAAGSVCYGDEKGVNQHPPSRIPDCEDYRCCAELCELPDGVCSQAGAVCRPLPVMSAFLGCFANAGVCLLSD